MPQTCRDWQPYHVARVLRSRLETDEAVALVVAAAQEVTRTMHTTTRTSLHGLIDALPENELDTAEKLLSELAESGVDRTATRSTVTTRSVAEAPPIGSIDELRGDFWPEDEESDAFEETFRRWRDEDQRG